MKKTILTLVILAAGCSYLSLNRELKAYKQYYEATENLLDTLENNYNWIDAFDPYDYYEAIENLGR